MRGRCKGIERHGFTLMEVVISVGVLAVVVPVVLAMVIAGGESSRVASDETQASLIARSVADEIRAARDGEGRILKGELEWPKFPTNGDRVVFAVARGGELVKELGAGGYATGEKDGEVRYLVSAMGVEHQPENLPDSEGLSRVEISVETPPAAKVEDRRKFVFVQLMHRDD